MTVVPAHVEQTPTLAAALAALDAGDRVRAEEMAKEAVLAAAKVHGKSSVEYVGALADLGTLRAAASHSRFALAAYREACAVELPDTRSAGELRCSCLKILGELLTDAKAYEEAEVALTESVELRRAVYGETHAAVGFGLESLAALYLANGQLRRAQTVIDEAVANLQHNWDIQIASALALRAEIRERLLPGGPLFEDYQDLPHNLLVDMAAAALRRVGRGEPAAVLRMLLEVRALISARDGFQHEGLALTRAIATAAKQAGNHRVRIAALSELRDKYDSVADTAAALEMTLRLAGAQCRARKRKTADANYQDAIARAKDIGDAAVSRARRNYGLFLKEGGRINAAKREMRAAIEAALQVGDAELIAHARCALGILLQHEGELEEAGTLLDQAIEHLYPADPSALAAHSHRSAVRAGSSCGCGDQQAAMVDLLTALVRERLPPGLLESVSLDPGGDIRIEVARPMTDAEAERAAQVVDEVWREISIRAAEAD